MRENPTWRVPASIQREEEERGKEGVDEIEPGPNNPLGKYWIGLSFPVIGIHGTNHPISVYSYRTHGCVRLHPDDIEALFDATDMNDRGEIVYMPVMLARLDDGRIFLESERDIYHRGTGGIAAVRALAQANIIDDQIDWLRAGEVVNDEEGIARDVTLRSERAVGPSPDPTAGIMSEPPQPQTTLDLLHERTDGHTFAAAGVPPGGRSRLPRRSDKEGARASELRLRRNRRARAMLGGVAGGARQGPGRQLVSLAPDCDAGCDISGGAGVVRGLGIVAVQAGAGSAPVQGPQFCRVGRDDVCFRCSGLCSHGFRSAVRSGVPGVQRGAGRFDPDAARSGVAHHVPHSRKASRTDQCALVDRPGFSAMCARYVPHDQHC